MSGHYLKHWEWFFEKRWHRSTYSWQFHRSHLQLTGNWNLVLSGQGWQVNVLLCEGHITWVQGLAMLPWKQHPSRRSWQDKCGEECPKQTPEVPPWRCPSCKVSYMTLRVWNSATSSPGVLGWSFRLLPGGNREGRDTSFAYGEGPRCRWVPHPCTHWLRPPPLGNLAGPLNLPLIPSPIFSDFLEGSKFLVRILEP